MNDVHIKSKEILNRISMHNIKDEVLKRFMSPLNTGEKIFKNIIVNENGIDNYIFITDCYKVLICYYQRAGANNEIYYGFELYILNYDCVSYLMSLDSLLSPAPGLKLFKDDGNKLNALSLFARVLCNFNDKNAKLESELREIKGLVRTLQSEVTQMRDKR